MDRSLIAEVRARFAPGARGGVVDADEALDLAALAALAKETGARFGHLDGPATKAALLDGLASGLAFPDWAGRNWDALEEMLSHPETFGPATATLVAWTDPARLAEPDAGTFRTIVDAAAAARTAGGDGVLVVVAGPSGRAMGAADLTGVPPSIGRIGKVHHVALIVSSIEDSLGLWRDALGLDLETVMDIESDHVRIAFLGVGESKVELVEPTDDTTGVARFLANKGEGFHHVCFEVPNLAESLMRLAADGIELIDTAPRRGAEGPVAFLHPRSCHGVLVELIEAPGGPAWSSLGF
jgi:methylmalonyl-CoA/ethylmalonyl-CoA epimerase